MTSGNGARPITRRRAYGSRKACRQVGAGLEAVASGQCLDDSVVDQVICRVTIARQRQCVDPKPRKDGLQLLVEVANVVARLVGHEPLQQISSNF